MNLSGATGGGKLLRPLALLSFNIGFQGNCSVAVPDVFPFICLILVFVSFVFYSSEGLMHNFGLGLSLDLFLSLGLGFVLVSVFVLVLVFVLVCLGSMSYFWFWYLSWRSGCMSCS